MGSKDPCAAVTPRRNVRERIGHVCPTAFRHADPTRFADWIPGPIPWPITADRLAMVRESNSPGTSAPTVLAGLRLYRTAHHPCQCFQYGAHRPNLDKPLMGTIFMRGSRSREDSNLRGLAPLLLSGQSHSTALPLLHRSARRNKLVDVFVWISCSRWDSNPRPDD